MRNSSMSQNLSITLKTLSTNHKLTYAHTSISTTWVTTPIKQALVILNAAANCGEKRFLRELKAMASFPHAFLLLEFGWHQIEQYPVGSTVPKSKWKDIRIKGKYIMRVLTSAQIEQGIHVIACGDSKRAEEIAFRIMRHVNDL